MIEEALKGIDEETEEERYWQAYPIAEVGRHLSAGNGAKDPKHEWFNPHEQSRRQRAIAPQIPQGTARQILRLIKERKLPLWAAEYLNLDLIRLAAEDGR